MEWWHDFDHVAVYDRKSAAVEPGPVGDLVNFSLCAAEGMMACSHKWQPGLSHVSTVLTCGCLQQEERCT